MKLLALLLLVACGSTAPQEPDAGLLTWACEHPRCCVGTANACRDFGCCEDDGWRVAP